MGLAPRGDGGTLPAGLSARARRAGGLGMARSTKLPPFDRRFFAGPEVFTCIGSGALGGKAEGLALVRERVLQRVDRQAFPEIEVDVPRLTVITTELFDEFMRLNRLDEVVANETDDSRLALLFLKADLPTELVGDLHALIAKLHTPLAVRSSSLLEDALHHPFAGVYATKMIPNHQHDPATRFKKLTEAIKFVYASTFAAEARSYRRSVEAADGAEKMAVILQEIVGQRHRDRFYPQLSGVGRSYNYYPTGLGQPQDGVVNLALGLGKTIVDGGLTWTYTPAHPKSPPPYNSVKDLMRNTQTTFWAVDMGPYHEYDPTRETEYMKQWSLEEAEADETLRLVASTYRPESDRICPGVGAPGPRVLDFAPLLGLEQVPLSDLLQHLLALGKEAAGGDVEMEFAATFDGQEGLPTRFGLLQLRPMAVSTEKVEIAEDDLEREGALVVSRSVLGNGSVTGIRDVVYLKPDVFAPESTRQMAAELETINRQLADARRPYLLIGFGRWGTSDSWLGVPVTWGQISAARVIVEATLPHMNPDMSQGSHFFHNIIGQQVRYLSVRHTDEQGIDWGWLDRQTCVGETRYCKHVVTSEPLDIRVDGRSGRGVVLHHERSQ
jgi:hypothetical protein